MTAYLRARGPLAFPAPETADEEGLVAIGGDLAPKRLLLAYEMGIFPWFDEDLPPLWWSPDPRGVMTAETLHVPRRLARTLAKRPWRFTLDGAFSRVIRACSERDEGTWILPEMIEAYERLHAMGHAHSVEAWLGDVLAGGLYGVHRGGLFAAESMFHRATDGSKAALVAAVRSLGRAGIELVDVQFVTPHLASLGAVSWPRARYLARVAALREKKVDLAGIAISV
jgi:leucyl/phenylalanyl-tRNA---protein transferase